MAKEDLIPFNKLTEQEQKKIAQMGGKASVESRRKKAAMRDIIAAAFGYRSELSEDEIKHYEEMGMDADDINNQSKAIMQQIKKAAEGDLNALVFLRDTVGEKPKDSMSLEVANGVEVIIDGKPKS